jgi:hypothetical protein
MNINKTQKNAKEFICDNCLFVCSKQSDWNRHILRNKHLNNINNINKTPKNAYICDCGKLYKYYSGLWNHKKKCIINNDIPNDNPNNNPNNNPTDTHPNDIKALTNLVLELVKSNHDLQSKMIDVCKNSNSTNNNNNSSINNSHNKTFNLQVFLNEDCKDAMNLSEFVNSLQLQLSDLDNMGKLGYTEGISKIILTEMNDLEQTKRPVHCSDIKRETLYVKDEDKWEKEQPDHPKLNKAIRKIEQKNFGLMGEWQAEHPTYKESTSEENKEFLKLISHTVNGTPDNINKVIKKIAKEVVIDK